MVCSLFLTDFHQRAVVCILHLRHHHLFRPPFEFRCGELVGEGERGRPFPLPLLLGSCLNANESPNEHWLFVIQRMQSPLLEFFGILFACSFRLSFARSNCCKSVHISISCFEMGILDFLLKLSLGHQLQSAIVVFLVVEMSSLECRLATHISTLPTFQFASDSPTCCQWVCQ